MGHHDEGHLTVSLALKRMLGHFDPEKARSNLSKFQNGVSMDASAWDISVSNMLWIKDGRRRALAAAAGGAPFAFVCGIMMIALCASSHIVQVGHELHEILYYGIMGSGRSSTSSSNSYMRSDVHSEGVYAVDGHIGLSGSMGDDNVSRDRITNEHKAVWSALGMKIEESGETVPLGSPVSFTSFMYDLDKATAKFANGPKLLLRLAYMHRDGRVLTQEQANGIRFAVRNTEFEELVDDYLRSDYRTATYLDVNINAPDVKFDLAGFF